MSHSLYLLINGRLIPRTHTAEVLDQLLALQAHVKGPLARRGDPVGVSSSIAEIKQLHD